MHSIIAVFVQYGGDGKQDNRGNNHILTVHKMETAQKVFLPSRLQGDNYLAKRFFHKNSLGISVVREIAKVVISRMTPMEFCFDFSKKIVAFTFYVQRYNPDNSSQDESLQALINSPDNTFWEINAKEEKALLNKPRLSLQPQIY